MTSLNELPDDMILQILNKLIDLKTLCFCHSISKRFSLLVLQIHTISFTVPLLLPKTPADVTPKHNFFQSILNGVVFKPINLLRRVFVPDTKPLPPIISSFYGESFRSAVCFLTKFKKVKSLRIELPSSKHKCVINNVDKFLFKWNVEFSNQIHSFMFISPNFVNNDDLEVNEMELSNDMFKEKVHIAFQCLKDVIVRHRMLLFFVKDFPLLENVCITDSGKRGRLCLSGRKVGEIREWVNTGGGGDDKRRIEVPGRVSQCFVPLLELPVSGYVMKGVTFVTMEMNGNDGFIVNGNDDGFEEDEEEVAYSEGVMEILENYKDRMMRLL